MRYPLPRKKRPAHPGTILWEQWMEPYEISQNGLAKYIRVPPRRINEIILGKRSISVDTAIRLGEVFGNTAEYWLALQAAYDVDAAWRRPGSDFHTDASVLRAPDFE